MTRSITIAPDQSMSEVLNSLKIAAGDDLVIDIPADSSILLTANEFRALAIAAERDEVDVSVYTDDPLRQQLATLFGVPLVHEIPEPIPYSAPELEIVPDFEPLDENGNGVDEPGEVEFGSNRLAAAHKTGVPVGRILGALAALAIIVALGVGLYWFFFTSMTVDVHLTRQHVATTLAYQVTDPAVSVDSLGGDGIVIQGQSVEFALTSSATVPATGETIIPDRAASGGVVLRNPTDTAVTIAKGTTFAGFTSVEYVFDDDVDVPASSDGRPGEAIAVVSAPTGGEAGNQDVGMLTGQLENGIYYSNRMEAISGGTQRIVSTVSQEDIDRLQSEIDRELLALATTTKLDNGLLMVPSSVRVVTPEDAATPVNAGYVFSQQPGDEATEVGVTATIAFIATAYDSAALTAAAIPRLQAESGPAQQFDTNSVQISAAAETGQIDGGVALLATVSGDAIPLLDDATKEELADRLAGKSATGVDQLLTELEYADGATVAFSPSWLPDRVPGSANRIRIETN